jgi:hypothetical protein
LGIHEEMFSSKRLLRDMDHMDPEINTTRSLIGDLKLSGCKKDTPKERSKARRPLVTIPI